VWRPLRSTRICSGCRANPALRKVVRQAGTPLRCVVEELGAGWRAASPRVPALMGLHHFVYLFDGGG
jgi:hypothetical protein